LLFALKRIAPMLAFTGTLRDGNRVIAHPVRGHYRSEGADGNGRYEGYFLVPGGEAMKLATSGRLYCLAIRGGPTLDIEIQASEVAFQAELAQVGFASRAVSGSP
jgi:hypothetical protein